MKEIAIGIMGSSCEGWRMLLEQEGVPHGPAGGGVDSSRWSALVASGEVAATDLELCKNFLAGGGGLLCDGRVFARLLNERCPVRTIRYFPGDRSGPFEGVGFTDVEARSPVPAGAHTLTADDGNPSAVVAERAGGVIVGLPFDAGERVLDSSTRTRSFYVPGRARLPFERVSAVSKGGIRRIVSRSLEILHHARGFPYAHLWYYPEGATSVFTWRVDTDGATRRQIESLIALTREMGITATFFVDVARQQEWLSLFAHGEGNDTGLHCFEHTRYRGYADSVLDIRKGQAAMERADIHPVGFASPYGFWNEGIGRAIQECGFEFSSEFSYDYDNLPSFPAPGGVRSRTLQVPVHPISLGSLRRQGCEETCMEEYFRALIQQKIGLREPVVLYHHPRDNHEGVVRGMVQFIRHAGVPNIHMGEFCRWWNTRSEVLTGTAFALAGSDLEVRFRTGGEGLWVRMTRPGRREALVPAEPHIDLEKISWRQELHAVPQPEDISRIRGFNPWVVLIRLEDSLGRKG